MALTARRAEGFDHLSTGQKRLKYPMLKGTLMQLEERLTVSEENLQPVEITFPTAPNYSSGIKSIKFDQQGRKGVLKKTLVVKKGVAMASGANKGLAMQAFLRSLKDTQIQKIVFVDDDIKNIKKLEEAYRDTVESILIIHYTEFSKEK